MSDQFVIQNGFVGNAMLFWNKTNSGYDPCLRDARVWTYEAASKQVESLRSSHPNLKAWPLQYLAKKQRLIVNGQDCDPQEAFAGQLSG